MTRDQATLVVVYLFIMAVFVGVSMVVLSEIGHILEDILAVMEGATP